MSGAKMHWMPFYVADYLADTGHLTTEEHGAYLLLIFHYWTQRSLPDCDTQLSRIARLSRKDWNKVRPAIKAFFDAGWKHKRIEAELLKSKEKYEKRARAGRKGGKVRRNGNTGPFSVIDGGSNA